MPLSVARKTVLFSSAASITAAAATTRFIDTYGATEVWPLNEASGTTIDAANVAARDGSYTGVDLAQQAGPGALSGESFPYWDGANDVGNIYSSNGTTGLADVFDATKGAIGAWAKVRVSGGWGGGRRVMVLREDTDNGVEIFAGSERIFWRYAGGATNSDRTKLSVTTTEWVFLLLTWDTVADEAKAYFNGSQEGATLTGLGTWATPTLSSSRCCVGAYTTSPTFVFDGYLALASFWAGSLPTPTDVSNMYDDIINGW